MSQYGFPQDCAIFFFFEIHSLSLSFFNRNFARGNRPIVRTFNAFDLWKKSFRIGRPVLRGEKLTNHASIITFGEVKNKSYSIFSTLFSTWQSEHHLVLYQISPEMQNLDLRPKLQGGPIFLSSFLSPSARNFRPGLARTHEANEKNGNVRNLLQVRCGCDR